ncbi:hypothetical protein [Croceivirga thetidis]|uniref:hypothetical protein n=1 Tax=Croceivirga thetidis TaxID=2721623 RepID=UPI001B2FF2BD|nr:hypothetical protein [Croceivirga thetidis]
MSDKNGRHTFCTASFVSFKPSNKNFLNAIKQLLTMVLMAIMIGVSNIVMEEERSINDTRARIEQQVVENDEEDLAN